MKIFLPLLITISACTQINNRQTDDLLREDYMEAKSKFATSDISHFPDRIETGHCKIITRHDVENNDIEILLYEFELSDAKFDSILSNIEKKKILAKYASNDTCLLVLNALPRDLCLDDPKYETMLHQYISKPCLTNQFPIPKFDDNNENRLISTKTSLGDGFNIFVLESKPGIFNHDISIPNMRMPDAWKNGISKGIASNRKKKEIIYWSIIW